MNKRKLDEKETREEDENIEILKREKKKLKHENMELKRELLQTINSVEGIKVFFEIQLEKKNNSFKKLEEEKIHFEEKIIKLEKIKKKYEDLYVDFEKLEDEISIYKIVLKNHEILKEESLIKTSIYEKVRYKLLKNLI